MQTSPLSNNEIIKIVCSIIKDGQISIFSAELVPTSTTSLMGAFTSNQPFNATLFTMNPIQAAILPTACTQNSNLPQIAFDPTPTNKPTNLQPAFTATQSQIPNLT